RAELLGVPQAGTAGYYPLDLNIQNGNFVGAQTLNLHVLEPPTIQAQDSVMFHIGLANTFYINTTVYPKMPIAGLPPDFAGGMKVLYTALYTGLPSGVTFTDKTPTGVTSGVGVLSGNPAPGTEGTYSALIMAMNGAPPHASKPFTLIVT